jgi:parallel beta-helix repeat protein
MWVCIQGERVEGIPILTHIRRSVVLVLLVGALVSSTLIVWVSAHTNVDVNTAHSMIYDGAYPNLVILDVRTKTEYDSGHIYRAVLIPVADLPTRIGELASHKYDPILVYCGSGGRSQTASVTLDSNGFTEVYNMLGGITAWKSAGYPTWISTVHDVNTTFNYDTIQQAIDSALTVNGNTIYVDNGTYREHVVVNKSLSIIGEDSRNTVIDGNGTGTAVSVEANNVTVESFTIRNSSESGVRLTGGNYAQIQRNNITSNYCGVNVSSSYNVIFNNDVSRNQYCGVSITSGGNTILENNITSNNYGVCVNSSQTSGGNVIYHNNLNNTHQAVTNQAAGLWNDEYTSGGNYWSDYNGTDIFSGVSQTQSGSDGVGDTAYTIDANNTDLYPLTRPFLKGPRYLTVISGGGGATSPAPGTYTYSTTTYVEVTAIAYDEYTFDHWELDGANSTQTSQIGIRTDADHTLKAVFARMKYGLTITSTAGGNTDPPVGTHTFGSGAEVSVNALPDPGYYHDGWELDNVYVGLVNPVSVTMNQNHTLHATFKQLDSGHDVETRRIVSKSVIGQGFNLSVQVTVMNVGSYPENFSVTVYVDSTSIAPLELTLGSGAYAIITFTLNTSSFSKGNYTLWAYSSPIPDETNTENNNLTGGWLYVSIIGDLTGGTANLLDFAPDGKVDMKDVGVVSKFFNQNVPPAPSNCDITGQVTGVSDGVVNMRDIGTVARYFGEHYP